MRKIIVSCFVMGLISISAFCQNNDKVKLVFFKDKVQKNNIIECEVHNDTENDLFFYIGCDLLYGGEWYGFIIDLNHASLTSMKAELLSVKAKSSTKVSYNSKEMLLRFGHKGDGNQEEQPLRLKLKYFLAKNDSVGKIIHSEEFTWR